MLLLLSIFCLIEWYLLREKKSKESIPEAIARSKRVLEEHRANVKRNRQEYFKKHGLWDDATEEDLNDIAEMEGGIKAKIYVNGQDLEKWEGTIIPLSSLESMSERKLRITLKAKIKSEEYEHAAIIRDVAKRKGYEI